MKFGICIPTFGGSVARVSRLLESIHAFTTGIDFQVFIRDDATPDTEQVALLEYAVHQYGAYFERGTTWVGSSRNLHLLGVKAIAEGCDVLVFLSDDCLVSFNWLYPIKHFYEWNANSSIGMVSCPFIEAWELVVAGLLDYDYHFYEWVHDGSLMREHLPPLTQVAFDKVRSEGRISIHEFTPLGGGSQKTEVKWELDHPVPIDGGLGPCFTISAGVFQEVDGFENCDFIGDYEAMIGWKCWQRGYKCTMIPGPPVYHARAVASNELKLDKVPEHMKPGTKEANTKFEEHWTLSFDVFAEAASSTYLGPASEALKNSRFIRYDNLVFPINITYDRLTEINLGPIHWRDERQQQRMTWIAEHVQASGLVLDVGCANGGLLKFIKLLSKNCSYIGVDLDRVRIDEAKAAFPEARFYVLDSTYGLPFSGMRFDTVVCADCLEHMPEQTAWKVVEDLCRCSNSNVIITLPISETTIPNIDHVWAPAVDSIQQKLVSFTGWDSSITTVPDFALIELRRKS